MDLSLASGDITECAVDAIVNAASSALIGGGGVDGAIHRAGGPVILAACRELRKTRYPNGLPTGKAVATTGGALAARWVIHTVGPVYAVGRDQRDALRSCYTASLAMADELGATTIAFPLISAGLYGWPIPDAIVQALSALSSADTAVSRGVLVLLSDTTFEMAHRIFVEG